MDGNIETTIELLKQTKRDLEELRETIEELQNIPEVDSENLDTLFGEEFKALLEYSSATRRLEGIVSQLDNVFVRNRFMKEIEQLKMSRSVVV